jgi:hypothetical protein
MVDWVQPLHADLLLVIGRNFSNHIAPTASEKRVAEFLPVFWWRKCSGAMGI